MPWFTIERTECFRVEAPSAQRAAEILTEAEDDSDFYSHTSEVAVIPDDQTRVTIFVND